MAVLRYKSGGSWYDLTVGMDQGAADARYLKLAGGTMTGDILLKGNATAALHPVTKQQLDTVAGANTPGIAVNGIAGSFATGETVIKGGTPTTQGGFTYSTVTGLYTVPQQGFYSVDGFCTVTATTSGWMVRLKPTAGAVMDLGTVSQNAYAWTASFSRILYLGANATFTLVLQAYNAAVTLNSQSFQVALV